MFPEIRIYHLLAISGLHASMLIEQPTFSGTFPVTKNTRHVAALVVLWLYQLFIGFIPSLFRATIMASLVIGSFLYQKKTILCNQSDLPVHYGFFITGKPLLPDISYHSLPQSVLLLYHRF